MWVGGLLLFWIYSLTSNPWTGIPCSTGPGSWGNALMKGMTDQNIHSDELQVLLVTFLLAVVPKNNFFPSKPKYASARGFCIGNVLLAATSLAFISTLWSPTCDGSGCGLLIMAAWALGLEDFCYSAYTTWQAIVEHASPGSDITDQDIDILKWEELLAMIFLSTVTKDHFFSKGLGYTSPRWRVKMAANSRRELEEHHHSADNSPGAIPGHASPHTWHSWCTWTTCGQSRWDRVSEPSAGRCKKFSSSKFTKVRMVVACTSEVGGTGKGPGSTKLWTCFQSSFTMQSESKKYDSIAFTFNFKQWLGL
ncbi:hypothetical protein BDK51DRAFT_31095 [Blyttiomyces helicus]|uniref:Uncharacterized protein n=1 Tax=Blyttiomyces helicus TaxID=388810 RepID=A0A4P9WI70_9FUNG|nr:hypothetical protein BDK51DRAFT_31095 [Blyttiomyces helicus]|eukprot:RKO92102.1 hypothetical protein BDK51DRAFT_31095 [Blyttiomyces helicus]